jgi:hypothetical protein
LTYLTCSFHLGGVKVRGIGFKRLVLSCLSGLSGFLGLSCFSGFSGLLGVS